MLIQIFHFIDSLTFSTSSIQIATQQLRIYSIFIKIYSIQIIYHFPVHSARHIFSTIPRIRNLRVRIEEEKFAAEGIVSLTTLGVDIVAGIQSKCRWRGIGSADKHAQGVAPGA